jgi:hypothetical protein
MVDTHREADDPTWARLEDQLNWYDRKSTAAQHAYKRMKVFELVVAAAIPVAAGLHAAAAVTASLGAIVVVCEGTQQLYQWHANYVQYRSTAEALKHERALYLAHAGPYRHTDRHRVLAERIEGLVSQEHAKWTESREHDEVETEASTES